jgi:predicted nucleic acid-binding protein
VGRQGAGGLVPSTIGVTVVLDSRGLSSLARNRARLEELRSRGEWPAIVPSVILTEALTGDHRRDHLENRLLRACDIRPMDELLARSAAKLRAAAKGRRVPSAVHAIVVAVADDAGGAVVLSSDPADLGTLANHTSNRVTIARA